MTLKQSCDARSYVVVQGDETCRFTIERRERKWWCFEGINFKVHPDDHARRFFAAGEWEGLTYNNGVGYVGKTPERCLANVSKAITRLCEQRATSRAATASSERVTQEVEAA